MTTDTDIFYTRNGETVRLRVDNRHQWDKIGEFICAALGLKVAQDDPVFDSIMAARKAAKPKGRSREK